MNNNNKNIFYYLVTSVLLACFWPVDVSRRYDFKDVQTVHTY